MVLLAFSHHTGLRLAEIGFLQILLAGVGLAAGQVPRWRSSRWGPARAAGVGVALALGGLLLILATHWGHFG